MNAELKQLRGECNLEQRLLIDKVISLVADDLKKSEDLLAAVEERKAWLDFYTTKLYEFFMRLDPHTARYLKYQFIDNLDNLRARFDEQRKGKKP
jgi:hypothetical protein